MYLKQLDILGFKSFPNKTVVKFTDGITSIVGPNGCGKTNILDALRWVLGEQKPTLLRGGKMEEIIFNGTSELKPLGMSEVTLTVVNDRGVLPIDYTEVQITRRLFRSGESEYLLNKVPCRLKDITDLFVDTGMGAHSYSVIQQDMIESIISDKAEERRFLFEEAAGITKYKQRKRAALRKIEATEQDFLRLNDIYSEVKSRVNSLNRQHKKAERYQALQEKIKGWELYLSATRAGKVGQEKRELRARRDEIAAKKQSSQTVLDSEGAKLESERTELLDIERSVNSVGKDIFGITEKAHTIEREVLVLGEKRSNARTLIEKNSNDITQLEHREQELKSQSEKVAEERQVLDTRLRDISEKLTQADESQERADEQLLAARSSREEIQQTLLELQGQLSSGKTEDEGLKEQVRELKEQLTEVETKLTSSNSHLSEMTSLLTEHQTAASELLTQKTKMQERQEELASTLESLLKTREEFSDESATALASIEATEARYKLLEEMLLQYEGYESGVVAAMEQRNKWPGIAGTVAELFVPAAGLEAALESALGDISRCLICYERRTAEEIISYLRSSNKGRVGILVPDIGTLNAIVKRPELNIPGVVGWLDSMVTTDERLRPLLAAITSRTIVFDNEADVDQLLKLLPHGFSAVSSDGLYYGDHLIYSGSDDALPLFRRKERMQEEQSTLSELRSQMTKLQEQRNKIDAEIAESRAESSALTDSIESISEELETASKQVTDTEYEQRSLTTEIERLSNENKNCNGKLDRIKGRQYSLGIGHNELSGQQEKIMSRVNSEKKRLADCEGKASQALSEFSQIQVFTIELKSKVEGNESQLRHLTEIRNEIENTLKTKSVEIKEAHSEILSTGDRITELEKALKETFEHRERHGSREEELRQTQSAVSSKVSEREDEIKSVRKASDQMSEELHQLDMRIQSTESEIQMLADRMKEEYEIDIRSISPVLPESTPPEGLDERDYLQQLKDRLKGFGAVNLLALEEFSEASERETFLREQLEDLNAAKKDLQSTITRINQTARKLFTDTFEKVEGHFQDIFTELFAGGEAGIRLSDPNDPLESEIEIVARPSGKKLLPITMMSGGERALTAISLLFALYLVKPSPFCILDEIDAPLDDANCNRFLQIIRNFSAQTQFIIITHNKITMEAADNLYGVTMEQPGVSKLVAVRFTADNDGDDTTTLVEELPQSIQERISGELTSQPDSKE